MAIKKTIQKSDGIEVNYHRIALVIIDVNNQITVLRHSYLNEEGRQYEKNYAAGKIKGEPIFPYVDAEYMHFDYEEGMNIEKAYKWLKSQPEFEGAEDV